MKCLKCGANNIDGSSFCIKCGASFKEMQQDVFANNTSFQNEQPIYAQPPTQQPIANQNVSTVSLNYLTYIVAILIKPFKSFKEESAKLSDTKTSFVLALIISLAMTVVNLLTTIVSTVRVSSYSWRDGGYTYSWKWENLKEIKFFEVIGKNFLIYACIIFAIAFVFYLASLIIKKELNFIKSLSITATSMIPAVVGGMLISPLAGQIWSPLGIAFTVAGSCYSLVILYELINDELKLDDDTKIYFNAICFGILAVAGYYVFMKFFMGSAIKGLDKFLDLY